MGVADSMAGTRMKRAPTSARPRRGDGYLLAFGSAVGLAILAYVPATPPRNLLSSGVEGIRLRRGRRGIGSGNVEVDDDGFLAAAYHDGFHRFVAAGIQFLVR